MASSNAPPPQKVSLYSVNDLKNATDDALAPYLSTLPKPYRFKQSHAHTNIRLALGYAAVAIAAATFYADWKLGWDATKSYTTVACVLYFILNSFLTYHIWKVEAGRVFVGKREGGQKLTLQSSVQKHKPIYKLRVGYEAPSGKKWEDKEVEGRFMEWFNEDGFLQHGDLRQWLARNIDVVGQAESQNTTVVAEQVSQDDTLGPRRTPILPAVSGIDGTSSVKGRKIKKKA